MAGSRGCVEDLFARFGVVGGSTIEPLAMKGDFLVEVNKSVMAARRKTIALNATTATKAKTTPRA